MARVPYATNIDEELKNKLIELSEKTLIPQSKLIDKAIKLLLAEYEQQKSPD